ncbi:MAG: hypothetical protein LBB59_02525 [Campylobacteraceae bacterium]|jgi:hypothetical protein|nr:hypothetical protein [Campylobacteraceae bacterium]
MAVVAIGAQIVEVAADESEIGKVKIGDKITISAKAFAPNICAVNEALN